MNKHKFGELIVAVLYIIGFYMYKIEQWYINSAILKKRRVTHTYLYHQRNEAERAEVKLHIGDSVIDIYFKCGDIFKVEEINRSGWIWSSQQAVPYTIAGGKNFMDSCIVRKL